MKKLFTFVFMLMAGVASAQEQQTANFAIGYDVDSDTATYCAVLGQNGSPFGGSISGTGTITSVSADVEASSTTAFSLLGAGDIILVDQAGTRFVGVVASVTDGDTLVLSAAPGADFTDARWRWLDTQCGTAATDGWINIAAQDIKSMVIEYNQGDIALDARVECRGAYIDANPVTVYPGETDGCGGGTLASGYCQFAAVGVGITNRLAVVGIEPWDQCRVALKRNGADASEATTDLERVTVGLLKYVVK